MNVKHIHRSRALQFGRIRLTQQSVYLVSATVYYRVSLLPAVSVHPCISHRRQVGDPAPANRNIGCLCVARYLRKHIQLHLCIRYMNTIKQLT